jgi:hypothetical protein
MFILSVTLPPANGAAFGASTVCTPLPARKDLHTPIYWALRKAAPWMHPDELSRYAGQIREKDLGKEVVEASTGLRFRIDPADNAPHPCPCCARLVLPTDHAHAHADDAYCLGCYTWEGSMPDCAPANTAHPVTEESE